MKQRNLELHKLRQSLCRMQHEAHSNSAPMPQMAVSDTLKNSEIIKGRVGMRLQNVSANLRGAKF
jgi:hypothetical protein